MTKTKNGYAILDTNTNDISLWSIAGDKQDCIDAHLEGRVVSWENYKKRGNECIPVTITYEVKE